MWWINLAGPSDALMNGDRRLDRRSLLRLGGVGAAVAAGTAVMRPAAAGAATGAMQFGQQNDAGTDSTGLTSTNPTDTLHVSNGAGAPALQLRSGGAALIATGSTGGGVVGITNGTGPGVWGRGGAGAGPAVRAEVDSTTSAGSAVDAHTKGTGFAVLASIENTGSKSVAVRAQTTGPGIGIEASSALGIGARFAGKVAPLQLVPSAAASHPATGTAGELFVDHSNRLWFCKGGTNWHQLA